MALQFATVAAFAAAAPAAAALACAAACAAAACEPASRLTYLSVSVLFGSDSM